MRECCRSTLIRRGKFDAAAPYSDDLRERAVEEVKSGASRREVAEQFGVSPSAVIKWLRRWRETGSAAAKPNGGSVSPLEKYAKWFLDLIAAQPDLTLAEVMVAKKKARLPGSRSAVGRFFLQVRLEYHLTSGVETTTRPWVRVAAIVLVWRSLDAGWPSVSIVPASRCSTTTSMRHAAMATRWRAFQARP
jgi:transposase